MSFWIMLAIYAIGVLAIVMVGGYVDGKTNKEYDGGAWFIIGVMWPVILAIAFPVLAFALPYVLMHSIGKKSLQRETEKERNT